jgi:hypothetical protein
VAGVQITPSANDMYVDPGTDELYVDKGSKLSVFSPGGGEELRSVGEGSISGSSAVAVNENNHRIYANSGNHVVEFEEFEPPFVAIDNPAVVHATQEAGVHRYGDFQVSPNGRFAIFATRRPLDESYNNTNHLEVYRYDGEPPTGPALSCASCIPTGAAPEKDSFLPAHGLGLLNDGRVFFNSNEQLVLRDQNHLQDAYEWRWWKEGEREEVDPKPVLRLISTGVSPYDSGLLSVSRDGKDAFFFAREQLVEEDENLLSMRVYDAREEGGLFVVPSSPPCAASDECHGPGTVAAPPPQIGTYEGTGGQEVTKKQSRCPKGFHRRKVHGKSRCVKKHKRKRHHKRRAAKLRTGGNR